MAATAVALLILGAGGYAVLRWDEGRRVTVTDRRGDLMALVHDLVRTMPGPRSGGYDTPTAGQVSAMSSGARLIMAGRFEDAASAVAPYGYEVVRFTDIPTGRRLILLEQARGARSGPSRGWGLFVFSPGSSSRLLVEVAHPFDDIDTGIVGVDAFRSANARALLVAGASRFADPEGTADVAHDRYNVFESIHEALLTSRSVVFEPHGFETDDHQGYGDAVISNGSGTPDPVISAVAAGLRADGLSVCVYDGSDCGALGATTNVQGASTRAAGAVFMHLELSSSVRSGARGQHLVAEVVARATG